MEDEGVGSDDERPPTRAAPAESPARESLRPASKKKKLNQQLMIRVMFHAVAYAKAEGLTECPCSLYQTAVSKVSLEWGV